MQQRSGRAFLVYFLITLLGLSLVISVVGYHAYHKVLELRLDTLKANGAYKMSAVELLLNSKVDRINQTIEVLSRHRLLRDALVLPGDQSERELEVHWDSVLETGVAWERLSFIDLQGIERFGVYRVSENQVNPLPAKDLSRFSSDDLFDKAQRLEANEKYYAPAALEETEQGLPVLPIQAIAPVITPVEFNLQRIGYLYAEINIMHLIERIRQLPDMIIGEPMMVGEQGYYRFHTDMSRIYGDRYPSRSQYNFKDEYPDAWKEVIEDANTVHSGVYEGKNATFVFNRFESRSRFRGPTFMIIRIPYNWLVVNSKPALNTLWLNLSMTFGIALLAALIVGAIGGGRAKRQHQRRLAEAMVESMSAVVVTDAFGRVQDVNPSFERITGFKEADIIGETPEMLKSTEHSPIFYARLVKTLLDKKFWRGEIWCQFADARYHPMLVEIHAIQDKSGKVTNYVGSCLDLSEQKQLEVELREKSLRDPLTGCWNRRYLSELLRNEISRQRRYGQPLALATFDIDKFKRINDKHGHDVGDQVLLRCADVVKRQLRRSDALARIGGEEFVIVMPMTPREGAEILVERIRDKLHKLTDEPKFTVSMGMTVAIAGDETEELLKRADMALYEAKASGRNRSCFATPSQITPISVSEELLKPGAV
ncbi:diguanylate cyclase [Corallincola platygyrae]|uniref:Diguanylate cyclase n=1 Tax=Corallincola platygyrae TaxID=1193278 RepID=A0ABW4XQI0_9GAMM